MVHSDPAQSRIAGSSASRVDFRQYTDFRIGIKSILYAFGSDLPSEYLLSPAPSTAFLSPLPSSLSLSELGHPGSSSP